MSEKISISQDQLHGFLKEEAARISKPKETKTKTNQPRGGEGVRTTPRQLKQKPAATKQQEKVFIAISKVIDEWCSANLKNRSKGQVETSKLSELCTSIKETLEKNKFKVNSVLNNNLKQYHHLIEYGNPQTFLDLLIEKNLVEGDGTPKNPHLIDCQELMKLKNDTTFPLNEGGKPFSLKQSVLQLYNANPHLFTEEYEAPEDLRSFKVGHLHHILKLMFRGRNDVDILNI